MRKTTYTELLRNALLFIGVALLSNGCRIAENLDYNDLSVDIITRTIFNSIQGIY